MSVFLSRILMTQDIGLSQAAILVDKYLVYKDLMVQAAGNPGLLMMIVLIGALVEEGITGSGG